MIPIQCHWNGRRAVHFLCDLLQWMKLFPPLEHFWLRKFPKRGTGGKTGKSGAGLLTAEVVEHRSCKLIWDVFIILVVKGSSVCVAIHHKAYMQSVSSLILFNSFASVLPHSLSSSWEVVLMRSGTYRDLCSAMDEKHCTIININANYMSSGSSGRPV